MKQGDRIIFGLGALFIGFLIYKKYTKKELTSISEETEKGKDSIKVTNMPQSKSSRPIGSDKDGNCPEGLEVTYIGGFAGGSIPVCSTKK